MVKNLYRTLLIRSVESIGRQLVADYGRKLNPLGKAKVRLLTFLRLGLFLLLHGLAYRLVLLEGVRGGESPQRFKVLYAGDEQSERAKSLEYLEGVFFDDGQEIERRELGRCTAWQVRRRIVELAGEVDLVTMERNKLLRWQPPSGDWAAAPPWLRMVFHLEPGESWEAVRARMRHQKANIRLFMKSNLTARISHADEDFDLFFDCMHVPMIEQRHGDYGTVDSKNHLYQYFKKGMLLLIVSPDGEPVAGDLLYRSGDTLFAIASGVMDGAEEWIRKGALSAAYYYEIEYCHAQGINKYDVGECRPFINDGLYQHKSRWGMSPQLDPWGVREWLFWAPENSAGGKRWLQENPLIEGFTRAGSRASRPAIHPAPEKTGVSRP